MDDVRVLDQRCNWYGVIIKRECGACDGYDKNCDNRFVGDYPENEILRRYREFNLSRS